MIVDDVVDLAQRSSYKLQGSIERLLGLVSELKSQLEAERAEVYRLRAELKALRAKTSPGKRPETDWGPRSG